MRRRKDYEEEEDDDDVPDIRRTDSDEDLTAVDWLLCILCSGIACIVGLARLAQGRPSAWKMIGVALVFSFLWGILRIVI